MRKSRLAACALLAFAAFPASPAQPAESGPTDMALECGPGEWSLGDWLANEGCVSLTDNGQGRGPDCSAPDAFLHNGWCPAPALAAEILPALVVELPRTS